MKVAFRKKGSTLFSRLIRIYTCGIYSHAELVFSDGRSFSSDETDGGTRWKDWTMTDDEWDFLDVPMTAAQEADVRTFCNSELGSKYDMRGIAFSFLPIPIGIQSADKWFCSEICVAAIQREGYLTGYTPASISPNKMYKLLKRELEALCQKQPAAA
jgi:hypothetical protein